MINMRFIEILNMNSIVESKLIKSFDNSILYSASDQFYKFACIFQLNFYLRSVRANQAQKYPSLLQC